MPEGLWEGVGDGLAKNLYTHPHPPTPTHTSHTHITRHAVTQRSQCIQAFPPLPSTTDVRGALAGAWLQTWSLVSGRSL